MGRAETKWEKANISYKNYMDYINRKENKYGLTLIDLLYVSNFKGGNASINEEEKLANIKLKKYSMKLIEILGRFKDRKLSDLSDEDFTDLKKLIKQFLDLTSDEIFSIDGLKTSYASALIHFYFPNLVPIIDRRVLNGADINVEKDTQGQIKNIEQYYPNLIDKFYSELKQRTNLTIRALDREFFIKPIIK